MTKKQGDVKIVTHWHNETLPSLQFYRLSAFDFDFEVAVFKRGKAVRNRNNGDVSFEL